MDSHVYACSSSGEATSLVSPRPWRPPEFSVGDLRVVVFQEVRNLLPLVGSLPRDVLYLPVFRLCVMPVWPFSLLCCLPSLVARYFLLPAPFPCSISRMSRVCATHLLRCTS